MEKFYEFHWRDGKVEYVKGKSETDAAHRAGIGNGALTALDYVAIAKSVPMEYKEFVLISPTGDRKILSRDTLFVKQALEQLKEGKQDLAIKICENEWKVKTEVKPFKVIFTEKSYIYLRGIFMRVSKKERNENAKKFYRSFMDSYSDQVAVVVNRTDSISNPNISRCQLFAVTFK